MEAGIIYIVNKFGYLGIGILMAIENIFPPIPSEGVLTFGGFATTYTELTTIGVIFTSTIGSVIGAIFLYYVGKLMTKEKMENFIDGKYGKMLKLKKDDVRKGYKWFNKHGYKAVFIGRFVPIIRSIISVPAGASKMDMKKFLILTTLGTIIWNTILVNIGSMLGSAWNNIEEYMNRYTLIILAVIPIVFIVYLVRKKRK